MAYLLKTVWILGLWGALFTPLSALNLSADEQRWLQQHPILKFGSDPLWPPFEFRGADGQHQGISADYLKLVGQKLGVKIEVDTQKSWPQTLQALQSGELDAVAALDQTPQRQTYLRFTSAYLESPLRIYSHSQREDIHSLSDLAGLRVAIESGYKVEDLLRREYPQMQLLVVENTLKALQAVSTGAADAYVGAQATADFSLGVALLDNLKKVGNGPAEALQVRMASRRDLPQLQALLQKALDDISPEQHQQIRQRWIHSTLMGAEPGTRKPLLPLSQQQKQWLQNNPVIDVGVDGAWPPIDFMNRQQQHSGIAQDYLQYLQQALGVEFRIHPGPTFKAMLKKVMDADLMLGVSVAKTPQRQQKLWYSPAFFTVLKAIVSRDSSQGLNRIENLYGKTVAIEDGFSTQKQLQNHPQIRLLPVKNTRDALEAVAFGRADAYVGNRAVANWIMQSQQLTNLRFSGDPRLGPAAQHFVVAQDENLRPLIESISLALENMTPDRRREIEARWLQQPQDAETQNLQLTQAEKDWIAAQKPLRVGGLEDWPPYGFRPPGEAWQGITRDYLHAALDTLGLDYTLNTEPSWQQSLDSLRRGELDLMGSMAITDERREYLDFSSSYFWSPYVLVSRRDNPVGDAAAELANRTVAVEQGYFLQGEMQKRLAHTELLLTSSTIEALQAVVNGEADAYMGNRSVVMYLKEKHQWQNLDLRSTQWVAPSRLHFGVRKELQPLAGLLSKALDSMSTQQRRAIETRWLGEGDQQAIRIDLQLSPQQQAWLQQNQPLRIGSPVDWEPLSFADENGELHGLGQDYLQLLNQALNQSLSSQPVSAQQQFSLLQQGELDALMAVSNFDKRSQGLLLSQPYAELPLVLFRRINEAPIYGLNSLAGQTLLVDANHGPIEALQKQFPALQLLRVNSALEGLKNLAEGRASAYLGDLASSRSVLLQKGYQHLQVAAPTAYSLKLHFAVRPDRAELIPLFDKGLSLLSNEQKQALQARWQSLEIDARYREQAYREGLLQTLKIAVPLMLLGLLWVAVVYRQRQLIQQTQNRYQTAVNAVSEGIWELNLKSGDRYFSPGFFERLGYSAENMPSSEKEFVALVHPQDRSPRQQALLQAEQQGQKSLALKYRIQKADGSYIHAFVEGHTDSKRKRRVGILRDITAQRESERKIRRLTQALAQSPELICILQTSGEIDYVNAKLLPLTGYRESEILNRPFSDLLEADYAATDWASSRHVSLAGEEWHGEVPCQRKDGSYFWAKLTLSPFYGDDNDSLQLIAVLQDITAQRAAAQALKNSEAQLRHVLHMMPLAIIVADLEGKILLDNPQAAKEIEQQGSLIGRHTFDFYAHPETRGEILQQLQRGNEVRGKLVEFLTPGDQRLECLVSITPIRYERQDALLAVIVNISERRQLERDLAEAKQQAEQANQFKSRFLANMSHEIRTPMNAIIGLSHLALQRQQKPDTQDYLQKIQSSAQALLGIINDILDLSRIEAGRLQIEKENFYLDAVLHQISDLLSLKAEQQGLSLLFEIDAGLPMQLVGDAMRLGQVLTNLCGNAVKFTQAGEVRLRIQELHRDQQQIGLRFEVIDSGPGIAKELQQGLFESFRQADNTTTRRYGGSGLGLAISQELVQAMGGELQLDSEPGVGSRFYFELCLPWLQGGQRVVPLSIRDARVLVVDDQESSRKILQNQLESMKFGVQTAATAAEALQRIQTQRFAVALVDWRMPVMDGLQLIDEMRLQLGPKAPAMILVTAYGREELMHDERMQTLDGFLLKPVTPSLLLDTLVQALSDEERNQLDVQADSQKALSGHLLLVEDQAINRQVAEELLRVFGLQVSACESAEAALECLQQQSFDAALLDIQMPGMDGYELAGRIRANEKTATLPLIAVTANAISGDREKCLQAGFDEHVPKPIDPQRLYQVLSRYLAEAEQSQPRKRPDDGSELPHIDGLDSAWGLTRVGGNHDLYRRLLQGYKRDFGQVIEQLQQAIAHEDGPQAQRLAHSLRGVSANLGAEAIAKPAEKLEMAIKHQGLDNLDPLIQAVDEPLKALMQTLQLNEQSALSASQGASSWPQGVTELRQQLQRGSAEASQVLPSLQFICEQKGLAKDYQALVEAVDDYEFEQALAQLEAIEESLKRE